MPFVDAQNICIKVQTAIMDAKNNVETAVGAGVGSYKDLQGKRVLVSGDPSAFDCHRSAMLQSPELYEVRARLAHMKSTQPCVDTQQLFQKAHWISVN